MQENRTREYAISTIDHYLGKKVRAGRLSQENADSYRTRLIIAVDSLIAAGLENTAKRIGEREVEHLLNVTFGTERANGSERPKSKRWDICIVNGWLKFYKNEVMKDMMLTWPADERVHVDWLSFEEAVAIQEAAHSPVEKFVIHMELRLWTRRVEVRRLETQEVQAIAMEDPLSDMTFDGVVEVNGKGRGGGKRRTLTFTPVTKGLVEEYNRYRVGLIMEARERDPNVMVPKEYLIYRRGKRLSAYSESGLDSIVMRVAKRAGIKRKVLNHTLRRTGARIAYFAGVPLVEIMVGLGHRSEKETIKYLGLTVNELGRAQAKIHDFFEKVKQRMTGGKPRDPGNAPRVSS
jgi:site-specific recombinase XerD